MMDTQWKAQFETSWSLSNKNVDSLEHLREWVIDAGFKWNNYRPLDGYFRFWPCAWVQVFGLSIDFGFCMIKETGAKNDDKSS